jgi:hypothetical protein
MNIDNINFEKVFYNTLKIGWSFIVGFLFALYLVDAEADNNERATMIQLENTIMNNDKQYYTKEDLKLFIRRY